MLYNTVIRTISGRSFLVRLPAALDCRGRAPQLGATSTTMCMRCALMKRELQPINLTEQAPDSTKHDGLACRTCDGRALRVVYTRHRDGCIVRCRECMTCKSRMFTRERPVTKRIHEADD